MWKHLRYRSAVRRALYFIKIARAQDNVGYRALLSGKAFESEVITPLEEAYGWTDKDEQEALRFAAEFSMQTRGKGMRDKRDRLKTIMKISGSLGIVALLGLFVRKHFMNKKKED